MIEEKYSNNKNATSDFLRVLLALKTNVMRNLHCAEICEVSEISAINDTITCITLTDRTYISAIPLYNIDIRKNDVVIVIYTDTDFRASLAKIKKGLVIQPTAEKTADYHTKSYGVIIGIVYRRDDNAASE